MATRALTLLLLACALYQAESKCACDSDHPSCESGKCYKRSKGGSYSWRTLSCGACTSSYMDPSSKLHGSASSGGFCYSYYGSNGDYCWTKKKDGAYATSGCAGYNGHSTEWCCPDNKCSHTLKKSGHYKGKCFSYYGNDKQWCYTRTKNYAPAKTGCSSYDSYTTSWCCPDGGCSADGVSPLGTYIAKFAKYRQGKYVNSDLQGTATCWDLARAALESAKKAGYHPKMGHSYKWSTVTVPIEQAQPGDIAQFRGWKEPYLYAWNPHTAVVTDFFHDGTLFTMQQNPNPVAPGNYHPGQKTSGGVTIYRIQEDSRLRLFSEMPYVTDLHQGMLAVIAGIGSFTGLLAFALIAKRRRQGGGPHSPEGEVQDEMGPLYPDSDAEAHE